MTKKGRNWAIFEGSSQWRSRAQKPLQENFHEKTAFKNIEIIVCQ